MIYESKGIAVCKYCGFGIIVEGARRCCNAGIDYDALAAENARLKAENWTARKCLEGATVHAPFRTFCNNVIAAMDAAPNAVQPSSSPDADST